MSYQRVGLRQFLLRTGLVGVLLWAFGGVICGCGSNESPSLNRQDKKPVASARPQAKEILPKPSHSAAGPQKMLLGAERDAIMVIPPDKAGGRGKTAAEFKAMIANAKPVDPNLVPVIPPDKPGGRGMTLAEFKALTANAKPVDPELVPVIPPAQPGGRGMTPAEAKAMIANAKPVDPELVPVIPPAQPGGRGMTLAEFKALTANVTPIAPQMPFK